MSISGHILIIDDEAILRQTLARILQRDGLDVTTAASGEEGLALLSQQLFDLVYLDLRMPDMTGLETLKAIHSEFPEMSVILFTAQPDLNSAVEALRLGATDYLLKPLKPKVLIDRTQAILARQEKERRKREIQNQIEVLQAELKALENDQVVQSEPSSKPVFTSERFLTRGKLTLDLHTRRLSIGERSINLPPAAFDYLLVLVRHSPNVVDYQTLVAEAQGYEADFREARELVKWHIHEIRQAIEPDTHGSTYLINERGTGYRLVMD
jgi:two-component system, OmpR family, alkaline phosphatase synthesis response regulator PhoP